MDDTTPEARQKQLEILYSKTEEERFLLGMHMIDLVRLMTENRIREENPGISEIELKVEVFKCTYREDFSPEEMEKIITWMRTYVP